MFLLKNTNVFDQYDHHLLILAKMTHIYVGFCNYCCSLCSLKILNSIVFLGKACQYVNEKREKDATAANSAVKAMSKHNLNPQQQFGVQTSATCLDSNVHLSQAAVSKEKMPDSSSKSENVDKKKRTKKLEEIDRYTLCSNQIVL